MHLPNSTIVWCVNSTLGYINLTNWQVYFNAAAPGSEDYANAVKVIFAWYYYFVPMIPIYSKISPYIYAKSVADINWTYDCLPPIATYSIGGFANYWWNYGPLYYVLLGAFAPPGEVPPLAQAIANGSLWTNPQLREFAVYLGLPSPDVKVQECVASYFHIPYTPVHNNNNHNDHYINHNHINNHYHHYNHYVYDYNYDCYSCYYHIYNDRNNYDYNYGGFNCYINGNGD